MAGLLAMEVGMAAAAAGDAVLVMVKPVMGAGVAAPEEPESAEPVAVTEIGRDWRLDCDVKGLLASNEPVWITETRPTGGVLMVVVVAGGVARPSGEPVAWIDMRAMPGDALPAGEMVGDADGAKVAAVVAAAALAWCGGEGSTDTEGDGVSGESVALDDSDVSSARSGVEADSGDEFNIEPAITIEIGRRAAMVDYRTSKRARAPHAREREREKV